MFPLIIAGAVIAFSGSSAASCYAIYKFMSCVLPTSDDIENDVINFVRDEEHVLDEDIVEGILDEVAPLIRRNVEQEHLQEGGEDRRPPSRVGRRLRFRRANPLARHCLHILYEKGLDPNMADNPANRGVIRFEIANYLALLRRERNLRAADAALILTLAVELYFIPTREQVHLAGFRNSHTRYRRRYELDRQAGGTTIWQNFKEGIRSRVRTSQLFRGMIRRAEGLGEVE